MSEIMKALGRGRDEERQAFEHLVATLEHLAKTTTDAMELYGGRAVNGVLDVQTQLFPATGLLGGSYGVPIGSLWVVNSSDYEVTVVAGQGQQSGTAPSVGLGITVVTAQTAMPIAIANTTWTAFGTSGARLSWTAFSGLQAFGIVR